MAVRLPEKVRAYIKKLPSENRNLVRLANERARERWGPQGWALLSVDDREAYVARETLLIIAGQHLDDSLSDEYLARLCRYMINYAGRALGSVDPE